MSLARPALAGACVLAVVAGAFVPAAASNHGGCARTTQDGAWARLAPPEFTQGSPDVSSYAVSPDGVTVYASNGAVVLRTDDMGCAWDRSLTVSDAGTESARVVSLLAPAADAPGTVYALVQRTRDVTAQSSVALARSPDRGRHWSVGFELTGSLVNAAAGGPRATAVYSLNDAPTLADPLTGTEARGAQLLSSSHDSGASWSTQHASGPEARKAGTYVRAAERFIGMLVDPRVADHLWLYGPDGMMESRDGGAHLTQVPLFVLQDGVTAAALRRSTSGRLQLAVGLGHDVPLVEFTAEGSKDPNRVAVLPVGLPGQSVTSAALGPEAAQFALAAGGRVLLHFPSNRRPLGADQLYDVSPEHARLDDLQAVVVGRQFRVFGRWGNTIEVRTMPKHAPTLSFDGPIRHHVDRPDQSATFRLDASALHTGAPTISPDHMHLGLNSGQRRTVPYRLTLPAHRKVDVFFLLDVSDSMADKIKGLKLALGNIIHRLHRAGVDAWFGVGEYRDYRSNPAYARVRDISPPGPGLIAALAGLRAAGGGEETQLAALYQSATGAGQDDPGAHIAAGQQAHFRPDALHLILNASDEGFTEDPREPTYAAVAAALRAVDALQIGIAYESQGNTAREILENPQFKPGPSAGEARIARATGALAPPEGADCDGNGVPDLAPGQPLVCVIDPARAADAGAIGAAIVNGVLAAPDVTPVRVEWSSRKPVVSSVTPRVAPAVNLRYPVSLTFNVTYVCPTSLPVGDYAAVLTARARQQPVARARAVIDCRHHSAVAIAAPPIAAAFATVPAPPAEPVTNAQPQGQPQTQPQSQPQSQTQAQAQAGAAFQEQEDPQFAFAYTNPAGSGERELAFSRYRAPQAGGDAVPPVGIALVVGAAGGFALLRLRRRSQHALAHVRKVRQR